jgi:hypothetical protein
MIKAASALCSELRSAETLKPLVGSVGHLRQVAERFVSDRLAVSVTFLFQRFDDIR